MEMQATDLSARLLATENLTVVRSNVPTASFDIKSRVLTLPMWKEMTPEIEDMLVGHEVGHALYTLDKYIEPIKENPKMKSYLNILEDVRIEKLIKRKYPGLRKRMNEGYKQLNDKDFFGISKVPSLDSLILIDKINLYFKAGFQCGVKFDADEKEFVNRAERTETIDEVIQLAHDIYAFAKEQAEKRKQQRQAAGEEDGDEDGDPLDGDEDYMDFDMDEDGEDFKASEEEKEESEKSAKGKGAGQDTTEEDLESQTERAFSQRLEELADQFTEYRYHKIEQLPYDVVIGYKQVLKDLNFDFGDSQIGSYYYNRVYGSKSEHEFNERQVKEVQKFKTDSLSSVNYLIKEFEMKKSAQLYKRAQISKIGSLDMRKVYAYQLQDDLFKRVTTLPMGKNHGMIMMIDWSGSMSDVITDTIKQVINLAMFCNKAQIPYRVFAFTSQYVDRNYGNYDQVRDQRYTHQRSLRDRVTANPNDSVLDCGNFNLLELFSNKMSTTEFNTMIKKLLDDRVFWHRGYDLGGTPLNEALLWTYNNIGEYMKSQRIEKMNFITLSDGAGGTLQASGGINRYNYGNKVKHLIRDSATKKTYPFGYDPNQQSETLLKMIKDRYNIRTVGFYICANRRNTLACAVKDNVYDYKGNVDSVIDEMRKAFRQDGFYSLRGTGRDDLFIVPADKTKIDEGELTVSSDMSSRKLASTLGKYLNTKKTSRVLLSRFIGYIA
jgi:hypothetical protein